MKSAGKRSRFRLTAWFKMRASITIRRLDESLKAKLRVQATGHGRSMEAEAREILRMGLSAKPTNRLGLGESIRQYVAPFGGVELEIPEREAVRPPPED